MQAQSSPALIVRPLLLRRFGLDVLGKQNMLHAAEGQGQGQAQGGHTSTIASASTNTGAGASAGASDLTERGCYDTLFESARALVR